MAEKSVQWRIIHVTKTTAEWAAVSDVITKGVACFELTTDGKVLLKLGTGDKTYAQLPYVSDGAFDISNYSTTTEVDTKISSAVAALGNVVTVKGVKASASELPTTDNATGDLWFVGADGETTDNFAEYIWTAAGKWEFLGRVQTEVDLSGYATTAYVDGKVSAINDQLTTLNSASHSHTNKDVLDATTASYTTEEKTKLAGIADGATKTVVDADLSADSTNPVENKAVKAALDTKVDKVDGKALSTNDFTDALKTKLEGIAEGATAITVDTALDAASANPVENKAVKAAIDTKVDKVEGKGLSTNDYTTDEKTKLAGIETGANKTVVDSALDAESTNPVENKVVKAALDTKVDAVTGKALSTNDFTDELKTKLEGIAAGATAITVDTALSDTSTNPVENKAVKAALGTKVDAVEGKGLSTNDFTTEEKTKLAGLSNYDDTDLDERVAAIEEDYLTSKDTLTITCIL